LQFNFNAQKGRFGVNAFFSGNARLTSKASFSSDKFSTDTASNTLVTLQQDGTNEFKRHGFETGGALSGQ